jgi:pyridoxal phosphate enzyme (YggS family)
MSNLLTALEAVSTRIAAAAKRAGRDTGEITLVAVTKTYPVETVIEAYQAGLRHFCENRTIEQEKVAEFARWLAQHPQREVPTWHFIGHLQSRQVSDVLGRYDLIHSVDSLKLAERINRLAEREDYPPVEILLQCNVSGEDSKSGFEVTNWATKPRQLLTFLETVTEIAALDKVMIRGLMTMAPIVADPEEVRPVFRSLAALRAKLHQEKPELSWGHLSMGMTDDFEVAIEEGATLIRVGRALFGER